MGAIIKVFEATALVFRTDPFWTNGAEVGKFALSYKISLMKLTFIVLNNTLRLLQKKKSKIVISAFSVKQERNIIKKQCE